MKIDPNSPAFPQSVNVSTQPGHYTNVTAHPGLPIRLHAALELMKALVADGYTRRHSTEATISAAFELADALLAEYNKEEPKP